MLGLYFALYHDKESGNTTPVEDTSPAPVKVIENKDHF